MTGKCDESATPAAAGSGEQGPCSLQNTPMKFPGTSHPSPRESE